MQDIYLSKHTHFEHIDSTNSWAKLNPGQWASTGITLITAAEQSGGRGRFKRQWLSPSNFNIYATFCFWFDSQRTDMGHIPQVLAIAASQTLENHGFSPTIKWPNDLLLGDKKVGGILCETIIEHEKRGIVCGIGLNVNMPQDLLNDIGRPATSMLIEGGRLFEVEAVLSLLKERFIALLTVFFDAGFSPLFPLLQQRLALTRGEKVYFHDNQTQIEALFEGLNPDGSIELRLADGSLKNFHAGEFVY